ncbi:alpha-amylase family glycosyl hydrolase [Actinocorallia sp. A-T 12471]|uniref:alpha-amylase family glycosyl hydrolase n=1 Tax=Actinocorallia sp. A-T 12471 TaxID=3089813 RepID=UPI0029CE85CC|nr:alpha-amylase family glycosyl hydrolase [Actinocorallia sp. A-T 12471]MDX6739383.1 alpha-amylase family glycosyl hydrolase [Actinocorallia sp. A-T 12471]
MAPLRGSAPRPRRVLRTGLAAVLGASLLSPVIASPTAAAPGDHRPKPARSGPSGRADAEDRRLLKDAPVRPSLSRERFYFAMTDRFANGDRSNDKGGLSGGPLTTGYDPTKRGFYQGGDLAGLIGKLDYIKGLGSTSLWLTPMFANRPVQGTGDNVSAGYHGYWITDFTRIDPHLGTNAEMKRLVKEAHKRGMKVFFDVITNHTADIIDYAEKKYSYRPKSTSPYLDADNRPFDDRDYDAAGSPAFPELTDKSFPYTPVVDASLPKKVPAWLNDVTLYHNRGDSTFAGESGEYGDFYGLDDLFTEHPRVVKGMTDIYRTWVKEAGIDGFRIDTVKHVNLEFWKQFAPDVLGYARKQGKKDFFMFGEVYSSDVAVTSKYTSEGRLQSVLDFPFQEAARAYASGGSADVLRRLYAQDDRYTDGDGNAYSLPTFLGNHDMGRIGGFLQRDNPGISDAELLKRDQFAHQLMYLTRGQPVVYYGDEQGFTGDGNDQLARTSMFASQVPEYLDDDLIGTASTHARDNFDTKHPLYTGIRKLADLTSAHPALRDGAQIERISDGNVYAYSRIDPDENVEYVVAVNSGKAPAKVKIPTFSANTQFTGVYGTTERTTTARDKVLTVTVPPLQAVVLKAGRKLAKPDAAPSVTVALPDAALSGRAEVTATVPGTGFDRVVFLAKIGSGGWKHIGVDDNRDFRVFHDVSALTPGTTVTYKAIAVDSAGRIASAQVSGTVAEPAPEPEPGQVARENVLVHYRAEDGDYDGLTVTASGDVAQPGSIPFAGRDSYGAFAWVKLAEDAQEVVLSVRDGDTAIAEHTVPANTGEIWLRPDAADAFASRAEAQGHATVHYRRPDGDYTGWGLHLWGEGLADGVATSWTEPRTPDGTDSYGAYWKIPLADAYAPLNFIVHRGDEKDPGTDQSLIPADQPDGYVDSGEQPLYASKAAADGLAVLHYRRADGDYTGWGPHAWAGAATPTDWANPPAPAGTDAFGVYWEIPLAPGAESLSYILHKGDIKDLPDDQSLDLATFGNEVWIQAATPGYLLPVVGGAAPEVDLEEVGAHLLDDGVVAWKRRTTTARSYTLVFPGSGELGYADGRITGDVRIIRLIPSGGLTEAQQERYPDYADRKAFAVDPRDAGLLTAATGSGAVVVERDGEGRLLAATRIAPAD